jgi:tyrosine-protein kinase Etk/Wzc
MSQIQNINFQEDSDIKKAWELVRRNYKKFIFSILVFFGLAFLINYFSIPIYQISSSVLIKEDANQSRGMNDFLNSNLFGKNENFQNELWVLKSIPVIEQTVRNLDLSVTYYKRVNFQYTDSYKDVPFKVLFSKNHVQPLNVQFHITFLKDGGYKLTAKGKDVYFHTFNTNKYKKLEGGWSIDSFGKIGKLLETKDFAFLIEMDSTRIMPEEDASLYGFKFLDNNSLTNIYKRSFKFNIVDKKATVIEINLFSESISKGTDLVNELMKVYSDKNLERKNHIASVTIDYIEKQLSEISDSLSMTEDNLQKFRSSNQLLDVTQQSSGISQQYMNLQNQRAELVAKKRYYDYVADYIARNDDFSNMVIPASMGIPDQILTTLMSNLITAQAQRSNLISNNQEKNPMIKKLDIQIENTKKTITENISTVRQTTDISLDEMNKRVAKIEAQISNIPRTERQLGGIERKYRLNDAIYNYLLEKRAEAKITKASNLPDDVILEDAFVVGATSPNKKKNYLMAFVLGLGLPFGFLILKKTLNNKIETQENLERLTDYPVLGKILHSHKRTNNVVFEFPLSTVAESYRSLRTNLDYYIKESGHNKVILITSCIQGEGKSFNALNLAMSYAQLGRKTILLDFDLRKKTNYFNHQDEIIIGLSSYLNQKATLEEIILKSPHEKLDYINSGPVPHNPVELLALDETEEMIKRLKAKYDYVIMDTPPLAQVTDGFLIMGNADIKVVVARYNFSIKNVFSIVMKDLKQKNTSGVCILLNDNRISRDQYGYGYGYNKKIK